MASSLDTITRETLKRIINYNSRKDGDPLPHSDTFFRELESTYLVEKAYIKKVIEILRESHNIFALELQQQDKAHDLPRIEAYVEADLVSIRRLKERYQDELVRAYRDQYKRDLLVHQIIKEIFPEMNRLKGTPLGMIANKAIMLEEYEKLVEKSYDEFNDTWKSTKLEELIKENETVLLTNKEMKAGEEEDEEDSPRRAIDSDEYIDYAEQANKYSINKQLRIYGIDFFFRVHLRKYNFELLREVVEKRYIDRRDDLKKLQQMIRSIRNNEDTDEQFMKHRDSLYLLERAISRNMYIPR